MTDFLGDRQNIADALSTVTGITGYASRPTAIKPGDAWPKLTEIKRGPGLSLSAVWSVLVILGPDESKAIERLDTWTEDLLVALQPVGFVSGISSVVFTTSAGDTLGLELRMESE